jgi:hypothetical protein
MILEAHILVGSGRWFLFISIFFGFNIQKICEQEKNNVYINVQQNY